MTGRPNGRSNGEPPEVLVVGAGPSGLTLALQAHDHGARVRVVERRPEAFRPSRALVMHPRTLEVLRPLGVTDALLARADTSPTANLHLGPRVVRVGISDLDLPDTAFPHLTLIRQAEVEAVLAEALAERGVTVERGTELVELATHGEHPRASLWRDVEGGVEVVECGRVAGCDGPASTVRAVAGIGWRGGPYGQEVVLADVELDGDLTRGEAHVVAGQRGLVFLFAIGERASWRLLATRPAGTDPQPFGQPGPPVPGEELQGLVDAAGLPARLTDVAWSARVRLQHRLATAMRNGPLFLVGDAAHAHSPAAAQGMNTGIQDATNLGWKLALAARAERHGDAAHTLLDSYEAERRPVARLVLALTHLTFWAESGLDPVAQLARGRLAPLAAPLLPALLRQRRLTAEGVRLLSGFRIGYRHSPLSLEDLPLRPGGPHAGDRLPDDLVTCDGRPTRLHDLTAGPGTHLLLARDAPAILPAALGQPGPPHNGHPSLRPGPHLHHITSAPGAGVLAIRPDGYVGYRSDRTDLTRLRDWLVLTGQGGPHH